MRIVLLDDIAKLGKRFEIKNVADGYGRNYLIPKGWAALADSTMLKRVERMKKKYEAGLTARKAAAAETIKRLDSTIINIEAKANEQGHLFEGLDRAAIAEAVKRQTKTEIDPDWLELERPIKAIGDYDLIVTSGGDKATIKLRIIPL